MSLSTFTQVLQYSTLVLVLYLSISITHISTYTHLKVKNQHISEDSEDSGLVLSERSACSSSSSEGIKASDAADHVTSVIKPL